MSKPSTGETLFFSVLGGACIMGTIYVCLSNQPSAKEVADQAAAHKDHLLKLADEITRLSGDYPELAKFLGFLNRYHRT
jgi:hypothetical protein